MKLAAIFLTLVALASAKNTFPEALSAQERSISSQIIDAIEAAKLQMPCGFPNLGVPPLAPLKLEHKEITTHGDSLDLEAEMDKIRVYGLNEFDIAQLKVNALVSRVTFEFKWPKVQLKMLYDILVKLNAIALFPEFSRNGFAKVEVNDFTVWGKARYSLGVLGGGVRLKELKIYASIGSVNSAVENLSGSKFVNRKINEIIEETIMLTVNDNTENIAVVSNDYVMPVVNNLIGDRTLGDLLAMISGGGGSGGEGEGSEESKVCIPPEDED